MSKNLQAVYENGVFRPLEDVDLAEHQTVTVIVPDRAQDSTVEPRVSCYELAYQAGLIGSVDDLPPDLSTNREYFEGFGR